MLEGKNNKFSLLRKIRSIFMQNCFIVSALQHGRRENPLFQNTGLAAIDQEVVRCEAATIPPRLVVIPSQRQNKGKFQRFLFQRPIGPEKRIKEIQQLSQLRPTRRILNVLTKKKILIRFCMKNIFFSIQFFFFFSKAKLPPRSRPIYPPEGRTCYAILSSATCSSHHLANWTGPTFVAMVSRTSNWAIYLSQL